MVIITKPRPGQTLTQAVELQRLENARAGVHGRVCEDFAELQAAILCGDPFRLGLVSWAFARMGALRDAVTQAEIRLRFEAGRALAEAEAKKRAERKGPYILVL
jgi:hypothetical protein